MAGARTIVCFALLALGFQALDLLTGLRMVLAYGLQAETNPLMRDALLTGGPVQVAVFKIGAALLSVGAFLMLARLGRTQLARICLLLAADLGALGVLSNGGFRFIAAS